MKLLCRIFKHKEKQTVLQRFPFNYETRSIDDGHVERHSAYQLLIRTECTRR